MADPDLQTLRLFLSIFDLRNLKRASERHNIAPSAVTKRLGELERHYGVRLFERRARGVVPTYGGEELARQVREIFGRLDRVAGTMSEFSLGARGQVRVHASASILLEALIDSIASFTRAHPAIRIDLQELMSWSIVRNVAEGRADIGLVAGSVEIPTDLTTAPYRTDRLIALCRPDHPVATRSAATFAELIDYEHVGIGVTSAISVQLAEEAGRLNRTIRHAYRTSTYDVARMMVARDGGIAVLPSSLVLPYAEVLGLRCVPLTDEWARREMRICYRDDVLTVAARSFLRHLEESRAA